MILGGALLAALGVVAGLLPFMFPDASTRTRLGLGSACLVLVLVGMGLIVAGEGENGSEGSGGLSTTGPTKSTLRGAGTSSSKVPGTTHPTSPEPVIVPGITGLSARVASALLSDMGLKSKVIYTVISDTRKSGRVVSQSPSAGTRVERGSVVILVVGRVPP